MSDLPHEARRVARLLLDTVAAVDLDGTHEGDERAVATSLGELHASSGEFGEQDRSLVVGAVSALHTALELLARAEGTDLHGAAALVREALGGSADDLDDAALRAPERMP